MSGPVTPELLAKGVLTMAGAGGMPDSFWMTDVRIGHAASTLGWSRERARTWGQDPVHWPNG
jgi:hypothetical protein